MSLSEVVKRVKKVRLKRWGKLVDCQRHHWMYRGHTDSHWTLKTSLERLLEDVGNDSREESGLVFSDLPAVERAIVAEFKRRYHQYALNVPEHDDNLEWLSIMRHYGAPTRLLDWTYSFHVALYFALQKPCPHHGAAVWAINTKWLRDSGMEALQEGGVSTQELDSLVGVPPFGSAKSAFNNVFLLEDNPVAAVLAVNPARLTERLTVQKGLFLCPSDVSNSFEDNLLHLDGLGNPENVIRYVIPKSLRLPFLEKLAEMNVSSASLFPGLQGFAESLGVYHHYYKREYLTGSAYAGAASSSVWK